MKKEDTSQQLQEIVYDLKTYKILEKSEIDFYLEFLKEQPKLMVSAIEFRAKKTLSKINYTKEIDIDIITTDLKIIDKALDLDADIVEEKINVNCLVEEKDKFVTIDEFLTILLNDLKNNKPGNLIEKLQYKIKKINLIKQEEKANENTYVLFKEAVQENSEDEFLEALGLKEKQKLLCKIEEELCKNKSNFEKVTNSIQKELGTTENLFSFKKILRR